jgi:hypothetical protein
MCGKEKERFGSSKAVFVIGDQGVKRLLAGLLSGDRRQMRGW